MSISDFFVNTLGANLSNTRWSWGASNPITNQVFLRVWDDQLETINGIECITILRTDLAGRSPGFPERKQHVEALREGAEGYGVLCSAEFPHSSGSRRIAHFNNKTLLRLGQIIDDGPLVYAQIAGKVSVEDLERQQTSDSTLVPDLSRYSKGLCTDH